MAEMIEPGPHSRHVTDIVTDVVGDDRGVTRVVLGDSRLHFAGQVGADVGRLGVNASPDARKEGDRGSTQAEAEQITGQHLVVEIDVAAGEEAEQKRDAEHTQTNHRESQHATAVERDAERCRHGLLGGVGGAGVGQRSRAHSQVAGQTAGKGSTEEGHAGAPAETGHEHENDKEDCHKDGKGRVLAAQEGRRAFVDPLPDLLHPFIARVHAAVADIQNDGQNKGYGGRH
jgi:hypothetical protein